MKVNKDTLDEAIRTVKEATNVRILLDMYGVSFKSGEDGKIYRSACPIHGGDNPTAFVFNNDTKHYKCFTNGCTGDVIEFVKKMEGHNNFWKAFKKLGEITGIDVEEFDTSDVNRNKYSRFVERSKKYYSEIERKKKIAECGINAARDEEELNQYPMLPSMCSEASKRYIDYETQLDYNIRFGRMIEDPFRHIRIIIPIYDENNNYIGQVGRSWKNKISPKYWYQPKGLNKTLFDFNLHRAKHHIYEHDHNMPTLFVCEGCFDVIKLWQMGYKNTVAIFGSEPTERQVRLMASLANRVVLCFDDDKAGVKATKIFFKIISEKFPSLKVSVFPVPLHRNDIGDMSSEEILEGMTFLMTPREWIKYVKDRVDLD